MVDARIKQVGRGIGWGRSWAPGAARSLAVAVAGLAALAAGALSAPPAAASASFPGELQTVAQMDCTPACTVCHTDPAGGESLANPRLRPTYLPLRTAVAQKSDAPLMVDTDMDTVSDLEELRAGTDPGSAANTLICTPKYGCFARVAPGRARDDIAAVAAALVAAALALSAGRRRRRPS